MLLHQKDPSRNSDKDKMKYILLSILLIASISLISIPDSFAEIEKGLNYDEEILKTFPNGSKQIKHNFLSYNRILDNGIYKDYIFTETANTLKIETANGFISLDKNSCGFNFDDKFTDSIVAYTSLVDQYSFNSIDSINNATCEAYYDQGNNSLVAKRYASNVGYMEYKYIFNNGQWKTQLEATNLTTLTNRVFAFDQTIDLNRDTIHYGGQERNLDNFSGRTFDRTWLENNEGKIITLLNGLHFDFDLGFENLDSISITDTGLNKSKLTFHYMRNNDILMPNETLIIDPQFTWGSANNVYTATTSASATTSCATGSVKTSGDSQYLREYDSTDPTGYCRYESAQWDTSSIPDTATVSLVEFRLDVSATVSDINCDITPVAGDITSISAGALMTDILDGTPYISNNAYCKTNASDVTVTLGGTANTDLQTRLTTDDLFGIGILFTDHARNTPTHTLQTSGKELQVTYTTTVSPDTIDDLTLDSVTQTTANISWSLPGLNGETFLNYMINNTSPQVSPVTVFYSNTTSTTATITGLTLGTNYSAQVSVYTTAGAGNWTLPQSLVLNYTTSTFTLPGAPTLSATALSDTALRFTSIPGTAGDNSTKDFGLQCELNGAGGWLNTVNNNTYASFYEYSGLTLGDSLICQWRDGSADGWSNWSNNATDTLALAILSGQRTIADTDDKLMQFINMVSGMGGVYFGLGVLPFGIMLIGFMAGKKTVRIFTLATLMLMGIVHASGYYVYPNWYWTLCLLFGLVLIMGRMKSD